MPHKDPDRRREYHREFYRKQRRANPEPSRASCRKYYHSDPQKSADRRQRTKLKMLYGITVAQYEDMLRQQGGCCKICGKCPTKMRLSVDHCHTTGKIRALLCSGCNVGLGGFKDNPDLLRKGLEYLALYNS